MKVCPVCSESFEDDLKFCDLDGTRLNRHPDAPAEQGHNKLWSMLGIGLLVGALVLSAVSVFLIPKSRVAPPVTGSPSQTSASSNKPATEGSGAADTAVASATNEQPEIVVTEGPAPDASKKKDKAKALSNENSNSSALNPKAAAQDSDTAEKNPQPSQTPAATAPSKPEPAPAVRTVSETREVDTASKPAASVDPKKDPKHQGPDSSKDSDKKKAEDKDKKKGGFFRVFKKIFGKD